MSRLKRQILTLAISLSAVLAAKVYLNRKLAQMDGSASVDPAAAEAAHQDAVSGVTVDTGAPPPGPVATAP